jgi:hypothetical protein
MALSATNLITGNVIQAADIKQFYDLLTGVMTDQSVTLGGTPGLVFGQAASRIVPGATSLALRNNANNANNVLVTDAGLVTIRAGLTITSAGLIANGAASSFSDGSTQTLGIVTSSGAGLFIQPQNFAGNADVALLFTGPSGAASVAGFNFSGPVGVVGATSATTCMNLAASTTARSSLRIAAGSAPTSPVDGDIWYTGSAILIRIGGTTKTFTVS